MWFIFAIIALLCWSGSDLFSKMGSGQNDRLSHYKIGIAVGLVMGLHAIYEVTIGRVPITLSDIVTYLPASAFYIVSMLVGYIGLRYIELSISSPICNGSGAIAALMNMMWFGVTFNPQDDSGAVFLNIPIIIGIVFIVLGIIGIGIVDNTEDEQLRLRRQQASGKKYSKSILAIFIPVIYCLLDSCGTFVDTIIADSYVSKLENTGMSHESAEIMAGDVLNTAYEFTWFAVAVILAVYVFVLKKERLCGKSDGTKLIGGICETAGQVFYMSVVVAGYTPGLVIISAYCAVSVLWSRIFLKEKLTWKHYGTIALTIAGIVILGVFDV